MATTEPQDIAGVAWDGNTDTTEATNAMATEPGYPAYFGDELVSIVSKTPAASTGVVTLTAADGREFEDLGDGILREPGAGTLGITKAEAKEEQAKAEKASKSKDS